MDSIQKKALSTIVVAYFMVQLSLVPIASSLPQLSRDLDISIGQSGWIMSIYLLTLSALLLISGRLGDYFGQKNVFYIGINIYLIASVLSGFSSSYAQLIIFRALQGVGTSLISANSLSLVSKLFPDKNGGLRGKAFGTVTSAAAFGSLIGIILGSIFLEFFSWRWIFFTNIPLAIYVLVTVKKLKDETQKADWRKIDFLGASLLYITLILLVYYLSSFSSNKGLSINPILLLIIILILFGIFIIVEKKAISPILVLSKFKNKLFVSSISTNFILHLVMINVTFFVPFLVEDALKLTPIYVGLVLLSVEFMNAIFPRISGALYDSTHSQWIRPIGMSIILTGFTSYWFVIGITSIIPYIILGGWIGIGMRIYWSVNNNIIMSSIEEPHYQGFASGMLETTRQLGHTFASALSAVLMSLPATATTSAAFESITLAQSIFTGTKNVLLVSVPIVMIGLILSFCKDEKVADQ